MTVNPQWRKTKTGTWVVYGPSNLVRPGVTLDVKKADGTKSSVDIDTVGKPFTADGRTMVYGYTAAVAAKPSGRSGKRTCDECGEFVTAGTSCWETGMRH